MSKEFEQEQEALYARIQDETKKLEELENSLGKLNEDTVEQLHLLTNLTYESSMYADAVGLANDLYTRSLILFGSNHAYCVDANIMMGMCYKRNRKYRRALEYLEGSYEQYKAIHGQYNDDTLIVYNDIAECYACLEEYDEAIPRLQEVYDLHVRMYGLDDIKTINALGNVAFCYEVVKNYEEAITCYKKLYELQVTKYGKDNRGTLRTMYHLADIYFDSEDYQHAMELEKEYIAIASRVLGENHLYVRHALDNYNYCLSVNNGLCN